MLRVYDVYVVYIPYGNTIAYSGKIDIIIADSIGFSKKPRKTLVRRCQVRLEYYNHVHVIICTHDLYRLLIHRVAVKALSRRFYVNCGALVYVVLCSRALHCIIIVMLGA